MYAQQRGTSARKLSAEDYIEIRQLYSRYVHYRMSNNPDLFGSIWTEDAEFYSAPNAKPQRGRKQIVDSAMKTFSTGFFELRRPYAMNELIDPSPEGAVGTSYFVMMKSPPNEGEPTAAESVGLYNDVFVKTPQGWKFKSRKYTRGPGQAPPVATPSR
jgi:hypothetical protein